MGVPLKPKQKADIDPNFQRQIEAQQRQAKEEGEQRVKAGQVPWNMPELAGEWRGDLFDWDGMKEPFNRDKSNEDYVAATSNPAEPGKAGDLIVTTTQIELLATMERAFRARHTARFPRMVAHATGVRRYGHGGEKGVFLQAMLDYVQGLVKQTGQ
jgi:hypothetical protein